jgi:hypothetical protein
MTKLIAAFLNFTNAPENDRVPTEKKNALERPERRCGKKRNRILKKYRWQLLE